MISVGNLSDDNMSRIPIMFLQPNVEAVEVKTRKDNVVSRIPSMFMNAPGKPDEDIGLLEDSESVRTPVSKRKRTMASPSTMLLKALETPPLPSPRGGIRAACDSESRKAAAKQDDVVARVESAYKGNVRSTLRVKAHGERASWAELTEKRHDCHFAIISKICEAVKNGQVKSRDEAIRMRDHLVACWGL